METWLTIVGVCGGITVIIGAIAAVANLKIFKNIQSIPKIEEMAKEADHKAEAAHLRLDAIEAPNSMAARNIIINKGTPTSINFNKMSENKKQ